jgi:hypothetical protein
MFVKLLAVACAGVFVAAAVVEGVKMVRSAAEDPDKKTEEPQLSEEDNNGVAEESRGSIEQEPVVTAWSKPVLN